MLIQHLHQHGLGNAKQRRQIRRAAALAAKATEEVAVKAFTVDQAGDCEAGDSAQEV